jgi:hypothetical protein
MDRMDRMDRIRFKKRKVYWAGVPSHVVWYVYINGIKNRHYQIRCELDDFNNEDDSGNFFVVMKSDKPFEVVKIVKTNLVDAKHCLLDDIYGPN